MMRTSFVALPLAVAVLSVATISTAEAGCRRAGGVATMVTKDLAVFMANAALKNSIADHGERAGQRAVLPRKVFPAHGAIFPLTQSCFKT